MFFGGVLVGVMVALAIAFAIIGGLESRFVTRREFKPILEGVQGQLNRIEKSVRRRRRRPPADAPAHEQG